KSDISLITDEKIINSNLTAIPITGNDNLIMYTFDCLNMYNF
ncbi:LysR family transcriptional regulator, partial [Escherichia coli]|nr:LysR family transcriptional regulator [Escherichia coli]